MFIQAVKAASSSQNKQMKRKWTKRKWRTSDGKYRLSTGENYLEKVKMSGENLSLSCQAQFKGGI